MKHEDLQYLLVDLPGDIRRLKDAGEFSHMRRVIEMRLSGEKLTEPMRKRLELELAMTQMLDAAYPYSAEEAAALAAGSIRDFTPAELEHYRDLDLDSIRRYRRNLRILLAAGGMTVMLFGASGVSYAAADHMQKDEYAYNLEAGRRSPNKQDSIAFYQKAIQTDCAGEEAYDQLLTLFTQDGVLDEQEEKVLLQLSISVDKYLERYKMQNPDGYAGLCYRIGSSYWYYYEHEEKRQAGAVAWFESAKAGFEGNPEKEQEWKRASTYVEIGNFYQRIVPAQISGTDQGMYGEYWNNLRRLKEWNDEAPDRDLVTLRLYREIVTKTLEYAGYLQEDGVPPQEMEDLLNEISQQTENMKTGAGQVLMEEIQELEQALKGAQQMLASCKWKGGAS